MKTICIYHSRDLDGWMSAAIVKKWFEEKHPSLHKIYNKGEENITPYYKYAPHLVMLGWDYGDDIPDLSNYDKVIMVDIAFPKKEMFGLFEKLDTNFIWIDHHASAIIDVLGKEALKDSEDISTLYNGFRDIDFAACELAWKYFMQGMRDNPDKECMDNKMPEIVRLLGRYDCFGHKGTDEEQKVLEFQYAARGRISNYEEAYKHLISDTPQGEKFNSTLIQDMLGEGRGVYRYLCTEAQQTYKKAFPIKFKEDTYPANHHNQYPVEVKRKFLCVNQERFNPINFGINYHEDGYAGFACFWYKPGKWHWSLYNDNEKVDCSVIAKQFGGGGHKGAAGMVIDDLSEIFIL